VSQSATLYRISYDKFKELKESAYIDKTNFRAISKDYSTFIGSFMAIEFILSKGQDQKTISLIKEIFNPNQELANPDIEDLSPQDQSDFFESGAYFPFLDSSIISRLNDFLLNFSEADVNSKYNPNELNDAGIYPGVWHNDNAENLSFNKRQILKDITELKKQFSIADKEEDYILVLVG
jgi:hypothetical protein